MSLMELIGAMSRLMGTALGTGRSTLGTARSTNSCYTSLRWFTQDTPLCRKLDNHAHPPYVFPSSKKGRWVERKRFDELYEYTVRPLPYPKDGGRGPNGRIWWHHRGGGHKRRYRMIDWVRGGGSAPEAAVPGGGGGSGRTAAATSLIEKVDGVLYDPNRSARIALVASGERKRYIIATTSMKAGTTIRSTTQLTRSPVQPVEGDSYPLGSLPLGTLVNCVEKVPGGGGMLARAAGVTALLLRKQEGGQCVVRLPSRREVVVSERCTATVGRVSNPDHNKRVIGKAGRNRWLGIRPRSGRWHRKTGRSGRKIRAMKPPRVYKEGVQEKKVVIIRGAKVTGLFPRSPPPGLYYPTTFI